MFRPCLACSATSTVWYCMVIESTASFDSGRGFRFTNRVSLEWAACCFSLDSEAPTEWHVVARHEFETAGLVILDTLTTGGAVIPDRERRGEK